MSFGLTNYEQKKIKSKFYQFDDISWFLNITRERKLVDNVCFTNNNSGRDKDAGTADGFCLACSLTLAKRMIVWLSNKIWVSNALLKSKKKQTESQA